MGLSSEEFWELTPREFMGLLDHSRDMDRRRYEYPAALISSVIANTNQSGSHRKRFKPDDFMSRPAGQVVVLDDPIARMDALATKLGLNNAGEAEAQRLAREAAGEE